MKRTVITIVLTLVFTAFAIHALEQTAFSGAGIIHSTIGGFKFPDGTRQTTAAYGDGFAEALAEFSKMTNHPIPAADASVGALEPLGCGNNPTVSISGIEFVGKVIGLRGYEAISELFDFHLVVESTVQIADPLSALKRSVDISIDDGEAIRVIKGMVVRFTIAGRDWHPEGYLYRYIVRVQPHFARLAYTHGYKITQNVEVPDLTISYLRDHGVTNFRDYLISSYPTRDFMMQYNETDLDYINRLLEEEGIAYIFDDNGFFTLTDSNAVMPSVGSIDYSGGLAPGIGYAEIVEFEAGGSLYHETGTVGSYSFQLPLVFRESASYAGLGAIGEMYRFPPAMWESVSSADISTRAVIEAERALVKGHVGRGSGNSSRIRAGRSFTIVDPDSLFSGEYLVTRAHHLSLLDNEECPHYGNRFEAIPLTIKYVPPANTPVPYAGPVTAEVVGPSGEEWYTDQYGRLKVQFFFDREGNNNENSSAWVRVAAPVGRLNAHYRADSIEFSEANATYEIFGWFADSYAFAANLERVSREVLVEFLNADPSLPVITGSLYNANHMPPVILPAGKPPRGDPETDPIP